MKGKSAAGVLIAAALLAGAGWISVPLPGTPVPQTAQTLVVLGVGIVLGRARGVLAVGLFLLLGVLGVPLFAGGASGLSTLLGPTGGFLVAFLAGALIAGTWVESGRARSYPLALVGMILAHAGILLVGWMRLAQLIGMGGALSSGVRPFLLGGLLKSFLAAALAVFVAARREVK